MLISDILRSTRNEVGRSQEYMALELGVARRTIQNWENGSSEPTIGQILTWFDLIHKNPIPYLMQYEYKSMEHLSSVSDVTALRNALMELIEDLPPEGIYQMLYILSGDHGSSPRAIMQLITAHLQTPLKDRVTQAGVIIRNYELAVKKGTIANPDQIQPDLPFLQRALQAGENAILKDAREYTLPH